MKRKFRLQKAKDFERVRAEGRSWANKSLVLSARPNDLTQSRFGFVVSRRIGIAVRRNRVKRLLREAARLRLPHTVAGWDIVVIARAAAADAGFWELDEALAQLLQDAGLLLTENSCGGPSTEAPQSVNI
jgi:ribonuclease P protein component